MSKFQENKIKNIDQGINANVRHPEQISLGFIILTQMIPYFSWHLHVTIMSIKVRKLKNTLSLNISEY